MVAVLEEQMWVEAGRNQHQINGSVAPHWMTSWIDEVREIIRQRKTMVENYQHRSCAVAKNKTIMQHAQTYVEKVANDRTVLELINHARMRKKHFYHVNQQD